MRQIQVPSILRCLMTMIGKQQIATGEIVTNVETVLVLVADVMTEGTIDLVRIEIGEGKRENAMTEANEIETVTATEIVSRNENVIMIAESLNHLNLTMGIRTIRNAHQSRVTATGLTDREQVLVMAATVVVVAMDMAEARMHLEAATEVAIAHRLGHTMLMYHTQSHRLPRNTINTVMIDENMHTIAIRDTIAELQIVRSRSPLRLRL